MEIRKLSILKAVINHYINTGCALSSSKLSQEYDFEISSATIRGELAQLENEGFLTHEHTSAGRIPTDKGYRYYVDHFVDPQMENPTLLDKVKILKIYKEVFADISQILLHTSELLTEMTNCFCLVSYPETKGNSIIKLLRLILINVHQILLVILLNNGASRDFVINIDDPIDEQVFDEVSTRLSNLLLDKNFNQIESIDLDELTGVIPQHKNLVTTLLNTIKSTAKILIDYPNVYKHGASKLMRYDHDFSDLNELRSIVEILEQENALARLLVEHSTNRKGVNFTIGSENSSKMFKNCTLGQAKYNFNNTEGHLVVIGPRRLNYSEVYNILNYTAKTLDTDQ